MEWLWIPVGIAVALAVLRYGGRLFARGWYAELDEKLGLDDIRTDIRTIKDEVTLNGGGSLKDRVLEVQRRVEQLDPR